MLMDLKLSNESVAENVNYINQYKNQIRNKIIKIIFFRLTLPHNRFQNHTG